jgi:hypothetical protein
MSDIKRYGYYIPSQDLMAGDAKLSAQAKEIYERFGLDITFACRFDGADVIEYEDGSVKKNIILRDFTCEICGEPVLGGRACPKSLLSKEEKPIACKCKDYRTYKRKEIA